ncbi:efflux RND transporter permease subunit [Escherichia coli]
MVRKCCCDVARVELGAEDYSTVARYNGKPAARIAIKLATGANALDTSRAVKRELNRLLLPISRKSEGGLSLRHHAVYRNFYSGSF